MKPFSPSYILALIPSADLIFETTRSQGPGGQNVNKTNSTVILRFNLRTCSCFDEDQRQRLLVKLANRLNSGGELLIRSEEERSQLQNRDAAIKKLSFIIAEALKIPKRRIPTQASRSTKRKRVDSKKKHAETKFLRKKIW